MEISICICTFRRPQLLHELLNALHSIDRTGLDCELVIVDNDPQQSAAEVIQHWREHSALPIHALYVSTPNIAKARNAAVHAASSEWIAIIDDDESPRHDWLAKLVQTQRAYEADAVFGPVLPRYPAGTPDWLRLSGVFVPHPYPTGTRLRSRDAYSGNVLIRRSALLQVPGPFDPSFGVTGGSDTMLFWDLEQRGARLIWCADAVVSEEVPASRLTLKWILHRSFRGGQSFVRAEVARLSGARRISRSLALAVQAVIRLPVAAALVVACLPFSRPAAVRWLRATYAQAGKLSALFGHRYQEYATT